ncbi:hypothetical protein PIB30_084318 [Stylosanthes scabra]|uniref:Uncharacterized protein n=1 Tax=Stylosanthes scabra TaxID=79078 RepID=A0ABU6YQ40_9FABA|nr:hypothetical protein [Stylosanthes scabra]
MVLLVRFGALAEIGAYQWNLDDLDYDSEPERTLLRRRREARRLKVAKGARKHGFGGRTGRPGAYQQCQHYIGNSLAPKRPNSTQVGA